MGMDSMCIARVEGSYHCVNVAELESNGRLTLAVNDLILFLGRTLDRVLTNMKGSLKSSD